MIVHRRWRCPLRVWRLLGMVLLGGCSYAPYTPAPVAFSGDASSARQSAVVPTLDTPCAKGKNVLWCGTLQLAWDQAKGLEPVAATQAEGLLARLNKSPLNPADLPSGSYYAAAGRVREGIVPKIQADMARKFPGVQPDLPSAQGLEALAYAYLAVKLRFTNSYFDRPAGDEFVDSAGHKTRITSFGLCADRDAPVNDTLARQIEVLYSNERNVTDPAQFEFVLDLDKNTSTQLILARVERGDTLAATWQAVREKMNQWRAAGADKEFSSHDTLAVPNLHYLIRDSAPELAAACPALAAMQTIRFQLDRSGASLVSESWLATNAGGRDYRFTHPFLIVLQKRGAREPYFVMWVDNAELLCVEK